MRHSLLALAYPVALALVASACGIDESQFTIAVCDTDDFDLARQVAPAEPVDFLELRRAGVAGKWTWLDAVGDPCAGAGDPVACMSALLVVPDWVIGGLVLAYSRGDEVGVFSVPAVTPVPDAGETARFLGTIDAPGDAALRALAVFDPLATRSLRCDAPAQIAEHPEGFIVYLRVELPCGSVNELPDRHDIRDHVLLVRTDGSIESLEEELIQRARDCVLPD